MKRKQTTHHFNRHYDEQVKFQLPSLVGVFLYYNYVLIL